MLALTSGIFEPPLAPTRVADITLVDDARGCYTWNACMGRTPRAAGGRAVQHAEVLLTSSRRWTGARMLTYVVLTCRAGSGGKQAAAVQRAQRGARRTAEPSVSLFLSRNLDNLETWKHVVSCVFLDAA